MIDRMNEIEKFSPYGGSLVLDEVKGDLKIDWIPENSVDTQKGTDRTMYTYIPKSGCYHPKQAQVLMVLRDENDEASAQKLMKDLKLDELAEEKHFVLLFPNPTDDGWNYNQENSKEDDIQYLIRCFASLPLSKGHVAGFNGMIFYVGATKSSSSMIYTMAKETPKHVSGMLLGSFAQDYNVEKLSFKAPVVSYVCDNLVASEELKEANEVSISYEIDNLDVFVNANNKNIKLMVSKEKLSESEIKKAWDLLLSETRRWQIDTHGQYQDRTDFYKKGFIPHVADSSLGVNDNFKHTWYEFVPERLKNSKEKAPLLFFFHGINCIPLYGAEQSNWHEIAEKEGFIVVYPKPAIENRWNVWDHYALPSDFDFVMALIDHMKETYEIDESRIYVSGFSMGSMFTNALACAFPEVFAAAAPNNAPHWGYLQTLLQSQPLMKMFNPKTVILDLDLSKDENESKTKKMADSKKAKYDYRMPVIQQTGLIDGKWPIEDPEADWIKTFDYWKNYNNITVVPYVMNPEIETGMTSDEVLVQGDDKRFIHHVWNSNDSEKLSLYELVFAKRMPHGLDHRQLEIAWDFLKKYARNADGSLKVL